jgi:hypothetical protein
MDAEHSEFVLSNLLDGLARSNDLHKNLPNFRDDSDQFADLYPLERRGSLTSGFSDSVSYR